MVRLDRLSGKKFIAHWFDPRTGAATPASFQPLSRAKAEAIAAGRRTVIELHSGRGAGR